jgi:signal transduction histidine kinase
MKHLFIIYFVCLLLIANIGKAQVSNPKTDSLLTVLKNTTQDTSKVNALTSIASEYYFLDAEMGLSYANKALVISKKINWNEGIAKSLCNMGINYSVIGEPDSAIYNLNNALQLSNNKQLRASIFKNLGVINVSKGNYPKSLEYSFEALKLYEDLHDETNIAHLQKNIGGIYYYTSDYKQALIYFNKALKNYTKLNSSNGKCKTLQNIGTLYNHINKDFIAITYFNEAQKILDQTKDKEGIVFNKYSLGVILLAANKFSEALQNIIEAKTIAKEIKNLRYEAASLMTEARIYKQQSEFKEGTEKTALLKKAEPVLFKSIEISKKTSNPLNLGKAYKLLSEIYSLKNEHKKAKELYVLYADLQDSILDLDTKETIKNIEDKRTIDLKNKEIEINKLTIDAKEKQKWYFIAGLILLFIIGALILIQSLNRKKINIKLNTLNTELDKSNKIKARFFSIINHDLRSPVSNIIHFLHLQKENPQLLNEENKKRLEIKIIDAAENLLNSMEDMLLWSKGQMEHFKPIPRIIILDDLFDELNKQFFNYQNVTCSFENRQHLQLITDVDYLKTIIRNLTSNAVKALTLTPNATIVWKATQQNNSICLSITDNGTEAKTEQFKALYNDDEVVGIKTGLGLHLIKDLAKAIDCKITVNIMENTGTSVLLLFETKKRHE